MGYIKPKITFISLEIPEEIYCMSGPDNNSGCSNSCC